MIAFDGKPPKARTMKIIDFSKSFMMWRIDSLKKPPATVTHAPPLSLNDARVQVGCHCRIKEKRGGRTHDFVLGENCKSERVGVERDIWTNPNADFIPVLSRNHFISFKTYDRADKKVPLFPSPLGIQPDPHVVRTAEAFDSSGVALCVGEGQLLTATQQIIESILSNHPLVARTRIESKRYVMILTYPVKTINANARDQIYQTDTGPVLLPDLSREPADLIYGLELAFVAFSSPTWAEFLVRTKTPVAKGVSVYHYSKTVRLDSRNELIEKTAVAIRRGKARRDSKGR